MENRMTESEIQTQLVQWLKVKGITFHVGLEGAKRHVHEQARLKRLGMQAGHPDITLFLNGGHVVFIELKGKNGSLTDKQRIRHEELRELGFEVHTVKAVTGCGAIDAVQDILDGMRQRPKLDESFA